jgi:hypothetical protein
MRALPLLSVILLAGACAPSGEYVSTTLVYREPPAFMYEDGDVERVVVVSREVLIERGYTVFRVVRDGPNRVLWARHGNGEVVRVFVSPTGRRVALRSVRDVRDPNHRHWVRGEPPNDIVRDIDVRVRARHR